jgi:hypothetical protein
MPRLQTILQAAFVCFRHISFYIGGISESSREGKCKTRNATRLQSNLDGEKTKLKERRSAENLPIGLLRLRLEGQKRPGAIAV